MPPPTVDPKSPAKAFVEAAAASRLIDREVLMRLYASGPPSATTSGGSSSPSPVAR